jgi:hypothetical protein
MLEWPLFWDMWEDQTRILGSLYFNEIYWKSSSSQKKIYRFFMKFIKLFFGFLGRPPNLPHCFTFLKKIPDQKIFV